MNTSQNRERGEQNFDRRAWVLIVVPVFLLIAMAVWVRVSRQTELEDLNDISAVVPEIDFKMIALRRRATVEHESVLVLHLRAARANAAPGGQRNHPDPRRG